MTSETLSFEHLLEEFSRLPKLTAEPTYLELCRYPASRFEEICTRLLCFYFDPTGEHNFNSLFIDSLLQLLAPEEKFYYKNHQIQVINELDSEGKRLDMLIKSPDILIGIENKINASIYNPLDIYARNIERYGRKNVFKVVLTVRRISAAVELTSIEKNGFRIVYYSDLFEVIKQNIGSFIAQGNQKYLTYIYDFIQTIENMSGDSYNNKKTAQFFANNSAQIENLISEYNHYNERILKLQKERIAMLHAEIKQITNDTSWWAWQDWDLGCHSFNEGANLPKIGIESSYETVGGDPFGRFRIYITTWKVKDFAPYEDRLRELFPEKFLDIQANRVYLHMEVIENDDATAILSKLSEYYSLLKLLVSETVA